MSITTIMKEEEQKIYNKLKGTIIKEIVSDCYKIKKLKKEQGKISITMGDMPSAISDANFKIIEELKKEGLIEDFKIEEEEISKIDPPGKPSPLEIEYDADRTIKKYDLEQIGYDLYKDSEGEKYLVANVKYKPSKIKEKYPKELLETKNNKERIKNILIVRPKEGSNKLLLILNNDYLNHLEADKIKECWNLFFRVAEREFVPAKENKGLIDYFNSNENNRIYSQTDYETTKILKGDGGNICPNINIQIISEKQYKMGMKKLSKQA